MTQLIIKLSSHMTPEQEHNYQLAQHLSCGDMYDDRWKIIWLSRSEACLLVKDESGQIKFIEFPDRKLIPIT